MTLLISRRQTLKSLATATAFASGLGGMVLSVAGCGGGGNDGGSPSTGGLRAGSFTAQVTLPSGSKVTSPAGLRVWTSVGLETPDATGKVKVTVLDQGTQYAEARDSSGKLVLAGFLNKGRKSLDAGSTAEALAYFALSGAVLGGKARMTLFEGVRGLSGFDTLVSAVSSKLTTTGTIETNDPAIEAALAAMASAAGQGTGRSVNVASGRGTLIEPTTSASGLSLSAILDGELSLTNVHLRRAAAWLDPVEYEVEDGATTRIVAATGPESTEQIDIAAPKRWGGFIGTVADIIQGNIPYTETTTGPVPIPATASAVPNTVATKYKLTVVGPGLLEGDSGSLSQARKSAANVVAIKAWFLDYMLPILTTVILPISGEKFDSLVNYAGTSAALSDMLNVTFNTLPTVGEACWKGQYADALVAVRDAQLLSNVYLPGVVKILTDWAVSLDGGSGGTKEMGETIRQNAANILDLIGRFDRAIAAGEYVIIGGDLARSNRTDVFTIKSTGSKVTVTPAKAVVAPGGFTEVTASFPNKNPNAVYRYEWSVSAGYRLLIGSSTTEGAPGGVLMSNSDRATLEPKTADTGAATVTCKVTRIDGTPDVPVGTGKTIVRFEEGVVVGTPGSIIWADKGYGGYWSINAYLYVAVKKDPNGKYYDFVSGPETVDEGVNPNFVQSQVATPSRLWDDRIVQTIPKDTCWVYMKGSYFTRVPLGDVSEAAAIAYFHSTLAPNWQAYASNWEKTKGWTWKVTLV